MAKYEISRKALEEGRKLGISEPVLPHLKTMIAKSTARDGIDGIRVFESFAFIVSNFVVCGVRSMDSIQTSTGKFYHCQDCNDTGKVTVFEVCYACKSVDGSCPCRICKGRREVARKITCQRCGPTPSLLKTRERKKLNY